MSVATVQRSHWARRSPGKARRVDPGSQETCIRPPGRQPSRKGVAHHMTNISRGLAAAMLALAFGATPATAANVTVRVEGAKQTLVLPTTVQPSPSVVVDKTAQGGTTCDGTSGGGALELATVRDWGGGADSQGQRVERIFNETYLLGNEFSGRFWSIYVNNVPASSGICGFTPQEGDEILVAAACGGATSDCFDGDPLDITAPATARPGVPFTAHVDEYTSDFSGPSPRASKAPSNSAIVGGGGKQDETDVNGDVDFTFDQRGPIVLTATKGGRIRDEATVCISDGADGFCGTTACQTNGRDGNCGSRDTQGPEAAVTSVVSGHRFAAGHGPRSLAGSVTPDPSGLLMVKLRLTRNDAGHCSYFSGKTERFRPSRCGASHGSWFSIGDRASWTYLLPSALPRGRYVLDVNAIDKAYNRDDVRRRGSNRVVFVVR